MILKFELLNSYIKLCALLKIALETTNKSVKLLKETKYKEAAENKDDMHFSIRNIKTNYTEIQSTQV